MVSASGERTLSRRLQCCFGLVAALGLLAGAAAHEIDELRFEAEMGFPEFAVVDVLDLLPGAGPGAVALPADAQMAIVETATFAAPAMRARARRW